MLKKQIIIAAIMAVYLPVCATPNNTTITSNGGKYFVTAVQSYVKLDKNKKAILDAEGKFIMVNAMRKYILQPNMVLEVPVHDLNRKITITRPDGSIAAEARSYGQDINLD